MKRDDRGDTLIEVLMALVVIALVAVAAMTAFVTAIGASVEESHVAELNTLLHDYAETTIADLQQTVNANGQTAFIECGTVGQYAALMTNEPTPPKGYAFSTPTIAYWAGTGFASVCPGGSATELFTVTASWTGGGMPLSRSLSFAVADYNYAPPA